MKREDFVTGFVVVVMLYTLFFLASLVGCTKRPVINVPAVPRHNGIIYMQPGTAYETICFVGVQQGHVDTFDACAPGWVVRDFVIEWDTKRAQMARGEE